MRKKLILFILLIIFISTTPNMKSYATITERAEKSQELIIEEAFLRSMSGEISNAIKDYYGEIWKYFLPRITKVTKNEVEDNFDVTVQVVTFQRAIIVNVHIIPVSSFHFNPEGNLK